MLSFTLTGGTISITNPTDKSGLIKTNVEVNETTVHLSRFISSKLHCVEIEHNDTIGNLGNICQNYTHLDDETFAIICSDF